jgi:hypothetical protein
MAARPSRHFGHHEATIIFFFFLKKKNYKLFDFLNNKLALTPSKVKHLVLSKYSYNKERRRKTKLFFVLSCLLMYLCREHKTKIVTNMALCFRVDKNIFS